MSEQIAPRQVAAPPVADWPAEAIQRLDRLDQYVADLQPAQSATIDVFRGDKMLRRYTERMLHLAIETCIQVAIALSTREGYRRPEDYRDLFAILGEQGVLSPDVAKSMIDLVEFRNVLVYEHEAIDETMVYGIAKRRVPDFALFSVALRLHLAESSPARATDNGRPFPSESPERLAPDQP